MAGENASVHTAHVPAIDSMTITLETPHNVSEECHRTHLARSQKVVLNLPTKRFSYVTTATGA